MDVSQVAELMPNLVVWFAVFLFSTSLHEASHALAAKWGGDYTAYDSGQVTLNPVPHMRREPVGMIVVPLLSFFLMKGGFMLGYASAPFNRFWAARYPRRSFFMALAGPMSHLLPLFFSLLVMVAGIKLGYFLPGVFVQSSNLVTGSAQGGAVAAALGLILSIVFKLNFVLFLFNILPIPPLDGGEVWYLFIKTEEQRLRVRMMLNSFSLAGIFVAWYVFDKVSILWSEIYVRLIFFLASLA